MWKNKQWLGMGGATAGIFAIAIVPVAVRSPA